MTVVLALPSNGNRLSGGARCLPEGHCGVTQRLQPLPEQQIHVPSSLNDRNLQKRWSLGRKVMSEETDVTADLPTQTT